MDYSIWNKDWLPNVLLMRFSASWVAAIWTLVGDALFSEAARARICSVEAVAAVAQSAQELQSQYPCYHPQSHHPRQLENLPLVPRSCPQSWAQAARRPHRHLLQVYSNNKMPIECFSYPNSLPKRRSWLYSLTKLWTLPPRTRIQVWSRRRNPFSNLVPFDTHTCAACYIVSQPSAHNLSSRIKKHTGCRDILLKVRAQLTHHGNGHHGNGHHGNGVMPVQSNNASSE